MRVKEIMDEKHPYIYEDDLATKARATIRDYSLRILPVVDKNGKLLGVVTRRSILAISSSVSALRVKGLMTQPRKTATAEEDIYAAVRDLLKAGKWYAPVIDSEQGKAYRGVLGLGDFIEAFVKTNPEKLARPASAIMSRNVTTCSPEDGVDCIWRLMQDKMLAGLPVVENGKLVGIVTQKDLMDGGVFLPAFESGKGRHKTSPKVSTIMKTTIVACRPDTAALEVAKSLISKDIGRVPIVDEKGKLVGIVDRQDIARLIAG